jgi:hypothetical protein
MPISNGQYCLFAGEQAAAGTFTVFNVSFGVVRIADLHSWRDRDVLRWPYA